MHISCHVAFTVLAVSAFAIVGACSPAPSETPGVLTVTDAWSMATPSGATVAAGYMTIRNSTAAPVRLVSGETPAAKRVEVHAMSIDGGVMMMRPIEGGLEIPVGGAVELKPGGFHLMLIGLKASLGVGRPVPLTLIFDNGMRVEAPLSVRAMAGAHGH